MRNSCSEPRALEKLSRLKNITLKMYDVEAEKRELPDYLLRLLKYRAEIECRIKSEDN